MAFEITADSTPVYDTWGWADYWSCEDWIAWHKALKDKYGKAKADAMWLSAWNAQDSFEHDYNWCKYGASFNAYVNAENLPVTHLLSDVISGVTNIGSNVITGATNTSKTLKWLVPVVLVIVIIGVLIYFGNKYKIFSGLKTA